MIKPLYRIANARTGNPIIPRNEKDPAAQFGNLRNARAALRKRIKNIKAGARDLVDTFTPTLVTNAAVYKYEIDAQKYSSINLYLQQLLYGELLDNQEGVFTNRWWLQTMLSQAYDDGTGDALQSAKQLAVAEVVGADLSAAMRSVQIEQIIFSPGFQSRVGFLLARTFNDMKGLTDSSKVDLADTLARSMAAGKGIREVKRDIMARVDVVESRAWRIARSEILNSYRTATANETDELNSDVYDDTPWKMLQLWWSALASTTRKWHAEKHGQTLTTQQVRDFYAEKGNSINCLCSQSPIMVNIKTGEVIQQELLDKMAKQRDAYLATVKVKVK